MRCVFWVLAVGIGSECEELPNQPALAGVKLVGANSTAVPPDTLIFV